MKTTRLDKIGPHRIAFEKNKKRLLKTATHCGICGQLVNKKLKYPNPMCAVIDHVVPLAKGGHPSAMENLQLAHMSCNRNKSDKLFADKAKAEPKTLGNRNLPQSRDWSRFASGNSEGG